MMRGLTLLCLVGLILAASWTNGDTVPTDKTILVRERYSGWKTPMENEDGFKNGTNSTAPVEEKIKEHNLTAQWNGTREVIENDYGFPPLPADEENTQGNTKQ